MDKRIYVFGTPDCDFTAKAVRALDKFAFRYYSHIQKDGSMQKKLANMGIYIEKEIYPQVVVVSCKGDHKVMDASKTLIFAEMADPSRFCSFLFSPIKNHIIIKDVDAALELMGAHTGYTHIPNKTEKKSFLKEECISS